MRPYKCNLCEKSFTQRCSLESHCLKVHGVAHSYEYKQRRSKVSNSTLHPWHKHKVFSFHKWLFFQTGVRLRGLRPHHQGARAALPPPEGEPPVQPRPAQVLRQEALQVQQLQLCQHAAPGQLLREKKQRRTERVLFFWETEGGV